MCVCVLQHQLENHTGDFCCTVQGFQYADDDDLHWPYMQFKVGPLLPLGTTTQATELPRAVDHTC